MERNAFFLVIAWKSKCIAFQLQNTPPLPPEPIIFRAQHAGATLDDFFLRTDSYKTILLVSIMWNGNLRRYLSLSN